MKKISFVFPVLIVILISGCTTTTMHTYRAGGNKSICVGKNIGNVAILPEVAWRDDQKEPGKRELMALEEIERSFRGISCGNISAPGGIREISNWSNRSESDLLDKFADEGVDTVILIRIEELTPRFHFTFSLPFLWGSSSEADFRIRALSVKSGVVLIDMRVKRFSGGPFNIRPAEWARIELNTALDAIIGNVVNGN
jgi:hypothetical protein